MKPVDVRMTICSSLSIASLWILTRFSTFFTISKPLLSGEAYTDSDVNQSFSIFMVALFIACIVSILYRKHLEDVVASSRFSSLFLGVGASLGFVFMEVYVFTAGSLDVMFGAGIFLAAVFTGLLFVVWGVRLMREPVTLAIVYFAIAIVATCLMLAVIALSDVFAMVLVVAAPLIAGAGFLLAPESQAPVESEFGFQEIKQLDWRLIVPVFALLVLSSLFNKLISPASSALIEGSSRLLTDAFTIVLFCVLLVYMRKRPSSRSLLIRLFVMSVTVMMLGLLVVVVAPVSGELFGGAILMTSFYCFVFLFMAVLLWDHVRTGASPFALASLFIMGAVIVPLLLSNTVVYRYAYHLQESGFSYSITLSAMLSFLVSIVAFVTLDLRIRKSSQQDGDEGARKGKLFEEIARDYGLSKREAEVLVLLYQGRTRKKISEILVVPPSTTQGHINHIYQKMGIHKRDDLIDLIAERERKR